MKARLQALWQLVRNNLGLKMLSLILAVVCWYAIRDAISFEVDVKDLPLEVRVQPGIAILNQSASTVDVTFRGSQEDIRVLDRNQLRAAIDLMSAGGAGSGEVNVSLGPANIEGMRGVVPVQVKPHRVQITLDTEGEKMVPVRGRYVGKPLDGQVEEVVSDPSMVRLLGPAQKLLVSEAVYTQPVDVEGRIESFTKAVPLVPPSESWVARMEPAEVQLSVVIAAKAGARAWKNVPVTALVSSKLPVAAEIRPAVVDVTLNGRSEELAALPDKAPRVFVDCVGLTFPARYDLPVHVYVPPEVRATAAADPATVAVMLQEQ